MNHSPSLLWNIIRSYGGIGAGGRRLATAACGGRIGGESWRKRCRGRREDGGVSWRRRDVDAKPAIGIAHRGRRHVIEPPRVHHTRWPVGNTGRTLRNGWRLRVHGGLLLLLLDHRKIHVVVFRLATDTKSSSLNIREDDTNKLPKRGRVQNRHALRATLLCIAAVHSITSYRGIALAAVFAQPRSKKKIRQRAFENNR